MIEIIFRPYRRHTPVLEAKDFNDGAPMLCADNDLRRARPERGHWSLAVGSECCRCHICPPCSWCTSSCECQACGFIEHEDDGEFDEDGEFTCTICLEFAEKEHNDARV